MAASVQAKLTPYFNFECEELCLKALLIRLNIHFSPSSRDDASKWKKTIPERRDSSSL